MRNNKVKYSNNGIVSNLHSDCEEQGYSIKSRLGGKSTLFNTNKDGTNFLYRLNGHLSAEDIATFNQTERFVSKFALLRERGCSLEFVRILSDTFYYNLKFIGDNFDEELATCLLGYYSHQGKLVCDLCEKASESRHILNLTAEQTKNVYTYRMKQFLILFALGMTANTPWDGEYQANGGYVVVKEDGDIVCFHFYDRKQLEDYLYYGTYFDTPSTKRHWFGNIFEQDDELYMKLNMQLRFL